MEIYQAASTSSGELQEPFREEDGTKTTLSRLCGEWASSSVAMKPSAMFTFTSSLFGYRKE